MQTFSCIPNLFFEMREHPMKIMTGPRVEIASMVHWKTLKNRIVDQSDPLYERHYTTSTKLFITERHFTKISRIIPHQKATDLDLVIISQREFGYGPSFLEKSSNYVSELDGFFYSLRSCIDSFFWEINYIFKLGCSRATSVWDTMKAKYPEEKMTRLLNTLNEKDRYIYLNSARNILTHYTLSEIETYTEDPKIYLPRNPETPYRSEEKGFEVIPQLKFLLKNAKQFLENGYAIILGGYNET